jgi:hypothetical protein
MIETGLMLVTAVLAVELAVLGMMMVTRIRTR